MADIIELPSKEQLDSVLAEPTVDPILKDLTEEQLSSLQKVLPLITARANEMAQVAQAKRVDATITELKVENQKLIEAELEKFRESNKPLDAKDIQKLLTQEYAEFEIEVTERKGSGKSQRTFVIRELPQATELRMVRIMQKAVIPHIRELNSIEWNSANTVAEKLQKVVDVVPEAMDTLSEICAIALDPYGDETITQEWVQRNMSSFRIMSVLSAQFMASKVRDFLSMAFHAIPS